MHSSFDITAMRAAASCAALLAAFVALAAALSDGGFIFTAPRRLASGARERVCIALKNATGVAEVGVVVRGHRDDREIASVAEVVAGSKCFELLVPRTRSKKGRLLLSLTYPPDADYTLNYEEQILIQSPPDVAFIVTDKPIYSGGHVVKFRIFIIRRDLTAVRGENVDKIWIENPNGVHLAQWLNQTTENGFLDKSFRLSREPLPGTWSVKVKRRFDDVAATHAFRVENYVLPRFSVAVHAPKTIEPSHADFNVTVCARYMFGEPVHGIVRLHAYLRCSFPFYCRGNESARDSLGLAPDGCVGRRFVLADASGYAQRIVVNATVRETGTGIEASSAVGIDLRRVVKAVEFSGSTKMRRLKPELPFRGQVIRKTPGEPEELKLCLSVNGERKCSTLHMKTDAVDFVLSPIGAAQDNNFTAFLEVNYAERFDDRGERRNAKLSLVPWYSPSGSYIQLEELSGSTLRCNKMATFNVLVSGRPPSHVHYMIKARGVVVQNGVITPEEEDAADFSPGDAVVVGDGDFSRVRGFKFDVNITSDFSPSSHVLVYYVTESGEVVADAATVSVNKCLRTQVSTRWTRNMSLPGDGNGLELRTAPRATCSLSVTDRSTKLLSRSADFNKDHVFKTMKRFEESVPAPQSAFCRNATAEPATDGPSSFLGFPETDSRFVDSLQAFEDFGAMVITDLALRTRPCKEDSRRLEKSMRNGLSPNAYGSEAEAQTKRSDIVKMLSKQRERSLGFELRTFFPETWIWDLVDVGPSGAAELSVVVPHTITEWDAEAICLSPETGLGVAEVKRMTTYQPFFLDFVVPHSVKRKEIFHLSVSVFNYEDENLPIKITYVPSNAFVSRGDTIHVDCVKSKSKIVHKFVLEPTTIGEAVVAVMAEVDDSRDDACPGASVAKTRDTVSKRTVIKHEGFPVEEVKSGFICGDNKNFENEISWSVKIPVDIVESSVSVDAFVCGDILGPSLEHIDKLVTLPTGCGEQNMVLLAPNILVLEYLLLTRSDESEVIERALKHLDLGYQKQLNYRHPDGSYSAFGEQDERGSIWLTAFVVRYLSQAQKFIHIDKNDLNASVSWIMKHQLENGCFPIIGRIYHRDLKGQFFENDSSKALTAYIIISLIESGVVSKTTPTIRNAVYCLNGIEQSSGTYVDLLTTYALLMVGEVREAQGLMLELLKSANRAYGLLWWDNDQDPSTESAVEMTAYGILCLLKLGGSHFTAAASDAVKWITQHRNRNGGFVSSQDTILALEAISKLSASLPRMSESDKLAIRMETTDRNYSFEVTDSNMLLLQQRRLPAYLTDLKFSAAGKGCALVQTHLKYNIRHGIQSNQLKVQLQIDSVSDIDLYFVTKFNVCVRHKSATESVKMAVLEVFMVSGFFPDRTSLHAIPISRKGVRKWEEYEEKVVFYFEDLRQKKVCVQFLVNQEACVEKTSPALIKLYDYYNNKHVTTVKYSLQPECNNNSNDNGNSTWLSPLPSEQKMETKRDVADDLETPAEVGPLPVYIPYESNYTLGRNCPYCGGEFPSAFPSMFCSAERVLKVDVVDGILHVASDLTPKSQAAPLPENLPIFLNRHCTCDVLTGGNATAVIVVAPPRPLVLDSLGRIPLGNSVTVIRVLRESQLATHLGEALTYCKKWSRDNFDPSRQDNN